ncbi:microphthalmia-associated transcription factor-like isoform X2 [Mytilus trossulus]|uniref:microphthalmia-associated transcription factor-like isoform X2 n=1 Tax=Mytilus trossulus TaxID=6551 RepID=UPI0030040CAF
MGDSGIVTDINSLFESVEQENDDNFYKLQSKAIVGSPKVDFKHSNMPLRANMKLQLQRQQIEAEEKRNQSMSQSYKPPPSQPQIIQFPISSSVSNVDLNVAPQILKVESKLQNPTQFHVQESKKRQIHMFLSNPHGKVTSVQSLPVSTHSQEPLHALGGSVPLDQDSNLSADLSSSAMSSEMADMELINELISLQTVDPHLDSDLSLIEPTLDHLSSTLPHANLFDIYEVPRENSNQPNSCPAKFQPATTPDFMTDEEARMWQKDRQKKDNHNQIERRRRFNINDRIKELGTLLPKTIDPDMRQNKGSILKASVDYIRKLRRDQERLKYVEDRQRKMESANRKMMLRMQQLELVLNANGMTSGMKDDMDQLANLSAQNAFQVTHSYEQEIEQAPAVIVTSSHGSFEDFMDDSSPVSGDPMLSSNPVSPNSVNDASDLFNC